MDRVDVECPAATGTMEATVSVAEEACSARSCPHVLILIDEHGANERIEEPLVGSEGLGFVVLQVANASPVGTDPETALSVLGDGLDDGTTGGLEGIEHMGFHAIETSAIGPDPKVALGVEVEG